MYLWGEGEVITLQNGRRCAYKRVVLQQPFKPLWGNLGVVWQLSGSQQARDIIILKALRKWMTWEAVALVCHEVRFPDQHSILLFREFYGVSSVIILSCPDLQMCYKTRDPALARLFIVWFVVAASLQGTLLRWKWHSKIGFQGARNRFYRFVLLLNFSAELGLSCSPLWVCNRMSRPPAFQKQNSSLPLQLLVVYPTIPNSSRPGPVAFF